MIFRHRPHRGVAHLTQSVGKRYGAVIDINGIVSLAPTISSRSDIATDVCDTPVIRRASSWNYTTKPSFTSLITFLIIIIELNVMS